MRIPTMYGAAIVAVFVASVLPASAGHAALAPSPVTAVTVRGTQRPGELTISWSNPADATYASARIVIKAGTTAATNSTDSAAVATVDVPAPASSYVWSSGNPGTAYWISVFAMNADQSAAASRAAAAVALPGAVRRLFTAQSSRWNPVTYTRLVLPKYADAAVLCRSASAPAPTSPEAAAECSAPSAIPILTSVQPDEFLAVFSVDTATGVYGPGVAPAGALLPPSEPEEIGHARATPTSLYLSWSHWPLMDGGSGMGSGGNVRYEVLYAPGTRTPVGNPAATQLTVPLPAPVGTNVLITQRIAGLVPDLPYAFAVRGVDSDGNTSSWLSGIGSTSSRGTFLVDNAAPAGRWRETALPDRSSAPSATAVEPDGTIHLGYYRYDPDPAKRVVHYFRRPGGPFQRGSFAPGLRNPTFLATSPRLTGVLAASDEACVFVRSPSGAWTRTGCFKSPVRGVYHPVAVWQLLVDNRGAVHVLFTDAGQFRYASNAAGRWVMQSLPNFGNRSPQMGYDRATDRLVVVGGALNLTTKRATVTILTKPARTGTFSALRARYVSVAGSEVLPLSVTSYGDRITIGARLRPLNAGEYDFYLGIPGLPVLLTATRSGIVGGVVAIAGARTTSSPVVAVATSASRVAVAWAHDGYSATEQGVWTAERSYGPAGGIHTTGATRRVVSRVDYLIDMHVDAAGRRYLFINR